MKKEARTAAFNILMGKNTLHVSAKSSAEKNNTKIKIKDGKG